MVEEIKRTSHVALPAAPDPPPSRPTKHLHDVWSAVERGPGAHTATLSQSFVSRLRPPVAPKHPRISFEQLSAKLPLFPGEDATATMDPCRVSPVWQDIAPRLRANDVLHLVRRVLQDDTIELKPMLGGYSNCQPYLAHSPKSGATWFVKSAEGREAPHEKLAAEAEAQAFFGQLGITPRVHGFHRDQEISALITDFLKSNHLTTQPLYGDLVAYSQSRNLDKHSFLALLMQKVVTVHQSGRTGLKVSEHGFDTWVPTLVELDRDGKLAQGEAAGLIDLCERIQNALILRGASDPKNFVPLHGDLHASNVRIHEGVPCFIDWGDHSRGDAAAELAYFSFMMDIPMRLAPAFRDAYAAQGGEDSQRFRERYDLWLAGYRIKRYAQITGWSKIGSASALSYCRRLHEDLAKVATMI